jgi:hypothetical protein
LRPGNRGYLSPIGRRADLRQRQDISNKGLYTLLSSDREGKITGTVDSFPVSTGMISFNTTGEGETALGPRKPRRIKLFAGAEGRTNWLISTPEEKTSFSLQEELAGTSTSQGRAKASSRSSIVLEYTYTSPCWLALYIVRHKAKILDKTFFYISKY